MRRSSRRRRRSSPRRGPRRGPTGWARAPISPPRRPCSSSRTRRRSSPARRRPRSRRPRALADRYDRRKLVLIGQVAMMVFGALLAALTHLGHATPWVVLAIAFAEGAAWAAVMPAWQALVPTLVPRDELPSAIALNSAQFNSARLIGPMLAGA